MFEVRNQIKAEIINGSINDGIVKRYCEKIETTRTSATKRRVVQM